MQMLLMNYKLGKLLIFHSPIQETFEEKENII